MKDPQRCLGSTREQAARKALSIRRSFGRPTLRESTFYLVPKDDDLDLQFAIRARTTGPDHAAEQCVEESEQHDRRCYIGAGQGDASEKTYLQPSAYV
jgi:hypothetical protein